MTQRQNSKQNQNITAPPKYSAASNQSNYSNQRCSSFQSLSTAETSNINPSNHLSHTITCPEHLDSLPRNNLKTPKLVPSISVTSDSSDKSNHSSNHHPNTAIGKIRKKMCDFEHRIGSYFRTNSKSPNPPKNDESTFKSYVAPSKSNSTRALNNGNAATNSLGRTNGTNFYNQSMSLQEGNNNQSNSDELKDLIITGNPDRIFSSNIKLINNSPSKLCKNFVYDSETKAEIKKMLDKIPIEERIKLQYRNYQLLKKQSDINSVKLSEIKSDIEEITQDLNNLNEPFKSAFEIEQLRGEIRALTNEKAELEYKYNKKTPWTCSRCTFASNKSDLVNCSICSTERDENEIFRCLFCGTKNPLSNRNCIKCDTYFNSAPASTNIRFHKRKSISSSSSSLASSSYILSPVLSTPNNQNYSHSNGASAQSHEDYPTHSPVIPRNYLNNANTYQFN